MFSEKRGNVLHGVLLIALFSCSAFYIAEFQFIKQLSFSPLIVGIILGMLYANSLRNHLPETWVPGILFCTKQVLRAGIVLYGFKLTFQSVIAIGLPAILIDMVIVVLTMQARRENQELLLERQEATRIIDASTNLFDSLFTVDLEKHTY